jgi:membrane protein YqaA with SNARE-associated domain
LFKKFYQWTISVADSPRALCALAALSFLEAFILPVPIDAITTPIMLANKRKIWLVVAIASLSSVLGGIAGYAIGYFLYEELGRHILKLYGHNETYTDVASALHRQGWVFVILGGTFVSYEVVTLTSGFAGIPFIVFVMASVLARGGRFLFFGLLLYFFGPSVKAFLDKYATLAGWIIIAVVIGGFIAARWLF